LPPACASGAARLSAFHRGSCLGDRTPPLSSGCALSEAWFGRPFSRPCLIPVQRAPRRPVIVPAGRCPGAARERGYEPRPQAPLSLRQSAVTGDVLDRARLLRGNIFGDEVKQNVTGPATRICGARFARVAPSTCRQCLRSPRCPRMAERRPRYLSESFFL
jgi:hypothetical protein